MPESLFNKVVGLRPATLLKMRLWRRCFPENFAKFLRTRFLTEHLWWLLLNVLSSTDWKGMEMNGWKANEIKQKGGHNDMLKNRKICKPWNLHQTS